MKVVQFFCRNRHVRAIRVGGPLRDVPIVCRATVEPVRITRQRSKHNDIGGMLFGFVSSTLGPVRCFGTACPRVLVA